MYKVNNIFFGLVLSLLLSFIGFFLIGFINGAISAAMDLPQPLLDDSIVLIMAVALNIFPLKMYLNRNAIYTGRGIMMGVLIATGYFIYQFTL